jgi:hypothetical protein
MMLPLWLWTRLHAPHEPEQPPPELSAAEVQRLVAEARAERVWYEAEAPGKVKRAT